MVDELTCLRGATGESLITVQTLRLIKEFLQLREGQL